MHLFFSPERLAVRGLGFKNPKLNACQLRQPRKHIGEENEKSKFSRSNLQTPSAISSKS